MDSSSNMQFLTVLCPYTVSDSGGSYWISCAPGHRPLAGRSTGGEPGAWREDTSWMFAPLHDPHFLTNLLPSLPPWTIPSTSCLQALHTCIHLSPPPPARAHLPTCPQLLPLQQGEHPGPQLWGQPWPAGALAHHICNNTLIRLGNISNEQFPMTSVQIEHPCELCIAELFLLCQSFL